MPCPDWSFRVSYFPAQFVPSEPRWTPACVWRTSRSIHCGYLSPKVAQVVLGWRRFCDSSRHHSIGWITKECLMLTLAVAEANFVNNRKVAKVAEHGQHILAYSALALGIEQL